MLHAPSLSLYPTVAVAPSADVLDRIAERETVATIWQRAVDPRITRDVAPYLPRRTFENGMLVWSHDHASRSLDALVVGLEPSAGRDALLADVRTLLRRWFEIAVVPHAFVSLGVIADPGCRKLHVDRVGRRLLSTYAGAATEWLEPAASDQWRRDKCCFEASDLRRLGCGDVLLMKGSSTNDDDGLVHRAPPWEAESAPRLLLRICDGEYHLHRYQAEASPRPASQGPASSA